MWDKILHGAVIMTALHFLKKRSIADCRAIDLEVFKVKTVHILR